MQNRFNKFQNCILQRQEGFSFVELLVSIAILAMVTTALVALINMNTTVAARAENKSRITDAMAQVADELRLMPFNDVKDGKYKTDDGKIAFNAVLDDKTTANGEKIEILLDIKTSKTEYDSIVKIIKVTVNLERSPDELNRITVILKPDNTETGEGNSIESFVVTKHGESKAATDGDPLWGVLTLKTILTNEQNPPQGVYMYANGTLIERWNDPENMQNYQIDLETKQVYPDGILHLRTEVTDAEGGFDRRDLWVTLDNHEPAISPSSLESFKPNIEKTNGFISISWDSVPDPDENKGQGAVRYEASLYEIDENGQSTPIFTRVPIFSQDPSLPPETNVQFKTDYKDNLDYELFIYVKCPPNCPHELSGLQTTSSEPLRWKF